MSEEPGSRTPESSSGAPAATTFQMREVVLPRVLCVDDDPNILAAFRRQFRKQFSIQTASSGQEALEMIAARGPYPVVVSDLRMPVMNGIQLLTAVRAQWPDTVRILLTGQADLGDAISAVNQGAVFRFLLKPSSGTVLSKVIEAALEQNRLIAAEKELTGTLLSCVEVLTEVLGVVEPRGFGHASRIRRYVRQFAQILRLPDSWIFEVAALLSQIGWITVPEDLVAKIAAGETLAPEERLRFAERSGAAARMIEKIPRLDRVARILDRQQALVDRRGNSIEPEVDETVRLGAELVAAASEIDRLLRSGFTFQRIVDLMSHKQETYSLEVLAALLDLQKSEAAAGSHAMTFQRLAPGMIAEEDILTRNGRCLVTAGQQITALILERLRGFRGAVDPGATFRIQTQRESPGPPHAGGL